MFYAQVFSVNHAFTLTPKPSQSSTTLVFVHGWLLSQRYWQPVIDRLKNDFQCLSYDLRGFGASTQDPQARSVPPSEDGLSEASPYSLAAYAQDLGGLLDTLGFESVWLVGHSLGGSVALWAAKLFPQKVAGVICVNAGGGVYLPAEFDRFRQVGQQVVRWRSLWFKQIPFIECAFAQLMVANRLALHWGKCRVDDLLAADPVAATGILLESTTESEVHQLPRVVSSLKQPVYFVAGQQDSVMEEKFVRHLASFHPLFEAGNVAVLPQCGHMAMVERPDELSNLILEYVKQHQPTPTTCNLGTNVASLK